MRTRIKFCGVTAQAEAELAVACGADAVGLILAPSPRRISLHDAVAIAATLPPFVTPTFVLVDPDEKTLAAAHAAWPAATLQCAGEEEPDLLDPYAPRILKVLHVAAESTPDELDAACNRYRRFNVLLDTKAGAARGGTGARFAWDRAIDIVRKRPTIVAGGLTPENVGEAIRTLRPYGVDVRSGIERDGRKDEALMRAFQAAVNDADRT
ncbi:MAG: phosphoribosylanthranilate isomerase [Candidatus Eremiobacteraeota bacterium]|uniref:phosphoribosylanthranilate isomerase n=1 Tax=mine drainage metagenome TaxID=410659 RepID=E6PDN1_9ZZZZ|nr:phosphoribosylanthranilate isomerase [Candidatus Eremiobacteraeota bacterium]NNM99843.1 phosphoribosylanthranilate isomerase [Candidatus Eremiobacteraeota bacterium]